MRPPIDDTESAVAAVVAIAGACDRPDKTKRRTEDSSVAVVAVDG